MSRVFTQGGMHMGDRRGMEGWHFQNKQDVFDYGKHKGRHVNLVDDYLEWIVKNFLESWRKAAVDALPKRERMTWQQPVKNNVNDLLSALKTCSRERDLKEGRRVHKNAVETGIDSNKYVAASLVNMYAKCGRMVDARGVFDSIKEPHVGSWNALILGYADNGEGSTAMEMFSRMKTMHGCVPSSLTFLAVIKACTSLAMHGDGSRKGECLELGKELHLEIRCQLSHFLQSTLINMYAKCGSMLDAWLVFRTIKEPNVVSCTALMLGYVENGECRSALDFFSKMKTSRGCAPNSVTYIAAIKACTHLAQDHEAGKAVSLKLGRKIHQEIGERLNLSLQNTVIHMYAKCNSMVEAQRVFDSIEEPNVVSWTALILGYADNGKGKEALDIFSRMKTGCGCAPNSMTYVAALKACVSVGDLTTGRKLHSEVADFNVHVVTCLVDFYAKCGSMIEAREMFDSYSMARSISTWTALMTGYGRFGDTVSVFNLFEAMQDQGCKPDAATFVCILSCCSHAGLIEKAREYLDAMLVQYGITPTVMHYSCMIDVLGRANQLDKAVTLLKDMPCNPDAITWMALLGVCRKWKNVEIGRLAFQSLMDLDNMNGAAYVLMAQLYGSMCMWEDQERLLETMRNQTARAGFW